MIKKISSDDRLKKVVDYLPLIFLFLTMLILHFLAERGIGDDGVLRSADITWSEYFARSISWLTSWTSRLMTIFFEAFIMMFPYWVWVVFDSVMIFVLAMTFSYLITPMFPQISKLTLNYITMFFFFLYPIYDMKTAGWINTTINYISYLTFATLALVPIKKIYLGEKLKPYEITLFFLSAIVGSNHEQSALYVVSLYALLIIDFILTKRKQSAFAITQFIVSFGFLIFHLVSPANKARFYSEFRWWPDYGMFNALQKLKLTIAATTNNFIQNPNAVFIMFCALLFLCVWFKYPDRLLRITAAVPLFVSLLSALGPIALYKMFPLMQSTFIFRHDVTLVNDPTSVVSIGASPTEYLPMITQLFVFLLIFVLIYMVFGNTKKTILLFVIYALGIISRLAMFKSPTLYASLLRTFLFMYASLIFIGICLWCELLTLTRKRKSDLI